MYGIPDLTFLYCSRLPALQVKCKVRYLNLPAVQNQISPLILTFGLADPVGANGIQADLASFSAMGCHGVSVITGILISDTTRIEDMQAIDPDWVADQARVVLEDMPVAAFKVGAVGNIENASVIAEIVSDYPDIPLIFDPFISAMPDQGQDSEELLIAIRELLIPQTTLLLASAVELGRLAETWREPSTEDMLAVDAMRVIEMGCEYLFMTGTPTDVHDVANTLFDASGVVRQDNWQRISGTFAGAGSTLSATIAAMLANGLEVPEAVFEAQEFTIASIANAQRLGMGKLIPDRYFWAREPAPDQ
jgi:hydroxymethylpyrimidine/phosphomethylpyrimidine kinase